MARFPRQGVVAWIGLRPRRGGTVVTVDMAMLIANQGLKGDHRAERSGGSRQVTLIQWEHLDVIAALCGRGTVDPALLRRNIAIEGINVAALKDRVFKLGDAMLEGTGACHPCSRMEQNLGPGGYNAVRNHGGITARVVESGRVKRGDTVEALIPA